MTPPIELVNRLIDLDTRLTEDQGRRSDGTLRGALYGYLVNLAEKEMGQRSGPGAVALVAANLSASRVFRVQENMTVEMLERSRELPDDLPVGTYPPPRPNGFLYFEDPLVFDEIGGHQQIVYYLTWTRVESEMIATSMTGRTAGWLITFWGDSYQNPDEVLLNIWKQESSSAAIHDRYFGRWAPVTIGWVSERSPVGTIAISHDRLPPEKRTRAIGGAVANPIRWVVALWQLLTETVPGTEREVTEEYLPKSIRKTARNRGFDPDELGVTTVVLRRQRKPTQHPGTGRKPTYRVEVEEYEAWRWVGPRDSPTRQKVRRKISKHMSSNDKSLPVRQRRVVNELRR